MKGSTRLNLSCFSLVEIVATFPTLSFCTVSHVHILWLLFTVWAMGNLLGLEVTGVSFFAWISKDRDSQVLWPINTFGTFINYCLGAQAGYGEGGGEGVLSTPCIMCMGMKGKNFDILSKHESLLIMCNNLNLPFFTFYIEEMQSCIYKQLPLFLPFEICCD